MILQFKINNPFSIGDVIQFNYFKNYGVDNEIVTAFEIVKATDTGANVITTATTAINQTSILSSDLASDYPDLFVDPQTSTSFNVYCPNGSPIWNFKYTGTNNKLTFTTSSVITPDVNVKPQKVMPAYNSIPFSFVSPNFVNDGYRYTADVYNTYDDSKIGSYKIVPDIYGVGNIDLSKILSNYTDVHFPSSSQFYSTADASETYLNYYVKFGEEYTYKYAYTNTISASTGPYATYTILSGATTSEFLATNQIDITSTASTLNGLHTVLSAGTNAIIIDVKYNVTGLANPSSSTGIISYADKRNVKYTGTSVTGLTVVNSALDWPEWKNWNYVNYSVPYGTGTTSTKFLTVLPTASEQTNSENKLYVRANQNMWLNFYTTASTTTQWRISGTLYNSNGTSASTFNFPITNISSTPLGNVKQVNCGFDTFGLTSTDGQYMTFRITNSTNVGRLTADYTMYVDKRCTREDVDVYFMDRYGSILSLPFNNMLTENGDVERDIYKQAMQYATNSTLDLSKSGTKVYNVNNTKSYELSSNWMNETGVKLYEELMNSPYVWVRFQNVSTTIYLPCIIKEKSYQMEKQRNKRLIRKVVNITLANNRPINA